MSSRLWTALFLTVLTNPTLAADWKDPAVWEKLRAADILFLDKHGWDNQSRSCVTLILNNGERVNNERHIVATGRGVYGYTYGGGRPEFFTKASALTDYMLLNFVEWDDPRPYFYSLLNADGRRVFKPNETSGDGLDTNRRQPKELRVYEQFYGLTGLLASYHSKSDPNLYEQIDQLYESFYDRFHDPVGGGFFDAYDMDNNRPVRQKSFASTIYPLTALYFSYRETIGSLNKKMQVERELVELARLGIIHLYEPETGRVSEKWDVDAIQNGRPFYMPGHGLQMAWVLLRIVQKGFVFGEDADSFRAIARKIIERAVLNGGGDLVRGGIYNALHSDAQGGFVWGSSKHWWQQAYPILAITLAERMGVITDSRLLAFRDKTIDFYVNHFVDPRGGVFAEVSENGSQVLSKEKGMPGKWAYHHTELAQFMSYYAKPISDEAANSPYPGEAISGGSMADCTPDARRLRAWQGPEYRITLPPRTSRWESAAYVSEQAAKRNRQTVEKFFSNYSIIGDWQSFMTEQTRLLSPTVTTFTSDHLGQKTYSDASGYFASLGDWSRLYSTGPDFRVEIGEVTSTKVVVRLHGTITLKENWRGLTEIPDSGHEWREEFTFDREGRIESLRVLMNIK